MESAHLAFVRKVDAIQARVQLHGLLPAEKQVALCSLDCYDQHTEYKAVHRCVEKCQNGINEYKRAVRNELESMEGSVHACQQSVLKRLQPQFTAAGGHTPTEAITSDVERYFQGCLRDAEEGLSKRECRLMNIFKIQRPVRSQRDGSSLSSF